MELNIRFKISNETIDDIMCCALEGGINYWCDYCEVMGDYLGEYASEQISRGGRLKFYDMEDGNTYILDKESFIAGIEKYISDYSRCGNIVVNGEVDACEVDGDIADVIVQLGLFNEIVFG